MRIETRNLLAEFLLEALDDHGVAEALRCFARYCRSLDIEPTPVSVDAFVASASVTAHHQVVEALRHHALFTWEKSNGATTLTLQPRFKVEYREIAARLVRYVAVIDTWYLLNRSPGSTSARELALQKGALLFNYHLFFEVHEILEEQWKQESGDVRLFLQGLIQIAVAFHHLGNRNFRGATSLLHDGLAKITPYQPEFLAVKLQSFIARLEICQQELQQFGPEHFQQFALEMIPLIEFVR